MDSVEWNEFFSSLLACILWRFCYSYTHYFNVTVPHDQAVNEIHDYIV